MHGLKVVMYFAAHTIAPHNSGPDQCISNTQGKNVRQMYIYCRKSEEVGYKQFVRPLCHGSKTNPALCKKSISASVPFQMKSTTSSCDVVLLACNQEYVDTYLLLDGMHYHHLCCLLSQQMEYQHVRSYVFNTVAYLHSTYVNTSVQTYAQYMDVIYIRSTNNMLCGAWTKIPAEATENGISTFHHTRSMSKSVTYV